MADATTMILMRAPGSRFVPESLAVVLSKFVADEGGLSWAGWVRSTMRMCVQSVPRCRIRRALKPLLCTIAKSRLSLTLVEFQADAGTLARGIPRGNLVEAKLSKRLLFTAQLVSRNPAGNCSATYGVTVFTSHGQ